MTTNVKLEAQYNAYAIVVKLQLHMHNTNCVRHNTFAKGKTAEFHIIYSPAIPKSLHKSHSCYAALCSDGI